MKELIGQNVRYNGGITGVEAELAEQHLTVGAVYPVIDIVDGLMALIKGELAVAIKVREESPQNWTVGESQLESGIFTLLNEDGTDAKYGEPIVVEESRLNEYENLAGVAGTLDEGDRVVYLGGDEDADEFLKVGQVYVVDRTGIAEHKQTGEEFPLLALKIPGETEYLAVIDGVNPEESNSRFYAVYE